MYQFKRPISQKRNVCWVKVRCNNEIFSSFYWSVYHRVDRIHIVSFCLLGSWNRTLRNILQSVGSIRITIRSESLFNVQNLESSSSKPFFEEIMASFCRYCLANLSWFSDLSLSEVSQWLEQWKITTDSNESRLRRRTRVIRTGRVLFKTHSFMDLLHRLFEMTS